MSCSGAVSRSSIRAPRMESNGLEAVQLWTRHDGPRHADAEFVEPSCARVGSFYSYTRLLHERIVVQERGLNWDFFEFLTSP